MEPFIGQIIMFGGNFAPHNWALCDGTLLSINENTALFSILGTTYGGDGRTNFALPDLRGRVAMHAGQGPGLSDRPLGQKSGTETVTLDTQQIPPHTHPITVGVEGKGVSGVNEAAGNYLGNAEDGMYRTEVGSGNLNGTSITGGGDAHTNLQPYLVVNYIIALTGIYPSRN